MSKPQSIEFKCSGLVPYFGATAGIADSSVQKNHPFVQAGLFFIKE